MKILQVNNIFPNRSTGKIMADIHEELKRQGHESVVCFALRDYEVSDPDAHFITEHPLHRLSAHWILLSGLMYGGRFLATTRLIRIIKREKPDVVHLHCINGRTFNIYRLVSWLKRHRVKTVVTLHAEFMYTANCSHAFDCEKWLTGCGNCHRWPEISSSRYRDGSADSWRKLKNAFAGFAEHCHIASVSPWQMARAKQSPILKDLTHSTVLNGLDVSVFHPRDTRALREQLGLTHEKVIFHATANFSDRANDIKGGRYVLELAERLKHDSVKLFVAGQYEPVEHLPENVVLLGNLDNQELLAQYYSLADVTLLSSKRETFSLVTAESLCCGTPVVGFEAGGPESIALREYSTFVPHGDMDALTAQVRKMMAQKHDPAAIAAAGAEMYSAKAMCGAYLSLYRQMMEDGANAL